MKLAVDQITESPKGIRFAESLEELNRIFTEDGLREFRFLPCLDVDLVYYRSGQEIFIQGSLGGTIEGRCSRCLKSYCFPLKKKFDFVLTRKPLPTKSTKLTWDEMGLSFYTGEEIDLSPFIREEVLLALPMRPLCEEHCRGLCAGCGVDLNEEPCLCSSSAGDPRMALFRTLKLDR